jgi:hypothetical protein
MATLQNTQIGVDGSDNSGTEPYIGGYSAPTYIGSFYTQQPAPNPWAPLPVAPTSPSPGHPVTIPTDIAPTQPTVPTALGACNMCAPGTTPPPAIGGGQNPPSTGADASGDDAMCTEAEKRNQWLLVAIAAVVGYFVGKK